MVVHHSAAAAPEKPTAVKRAPVKSTPVKPSKAPVKTPTVKKTAVKKIVKAAAAAAGADAIVPEKEASPLEQLRSAHKAIQLATHTSHLTIHAAPLIQAKTPAKLPPKPTAKKVKKKETVVQPKKGAFERMEKMADYTNNDRHEDDDADDDSDTSSESSWFKKLLKHP